MSLTPLFDPVANRDENRALVGFHLANTPLSQARYSSTLPSTHHQPTVLLAEDNADLRETTSMVLRTTGYRVISCSDAEMASHVFRVEERLSPVDLLLTDIEMPGRSGIELARELTSLRLSLPVLIVSGSLIPNSLSQEIEDRNWRFFAKPFRLPALLSTVQELAPSVRISSDTHHQTP